MGDLSESGGESSPTSLNVMVISFNPKLNLILPLLKYTLINAALI